MLADNQKNADPILDLKTASIPISSPPPKSKALSETRYQCVVCRVNKISLSELHWHQTYQHSTEELSLSVIGWKGLVKIVGPPSKQEKENTQHPIWSSFSKKPSQFYYLSSSILKVRDDQKGSLETLETPIDCSLPDVKVEGNFKRPKLALPSEKTADAIKSSTTTSNLPFPINSKLIDTLNSLGTRKPIVKVEDVLRLNNSESALSLIKTEEIMGSSNESSEKIPVGFTTNGAPSTIEKELRRRREISMEDFVKSANELCSDLEESKRISALKKVGKRKHCS
ncbi:hypothetical protein QAD02_006472 [Eretmocerus hayati]|uniref:Uncharacterized protein n=1 Tax=Eretmocerus hayati TaxID=131215 RepID=A0ACC2N0Z1_9HYME|nr:hypothetical protein QAD02_006472 [Eretmocerus hayati]